MHANLHINAISRSTGRSTVAASAYRSGRSVVACAAYRAGENLQDDRYAKTHDYRNKENVLHSEIITPEGAPEWMHDRQQLWNKVEAGEKRKDAQLAKEVVLTLPRNLDLEQQKEVVRGFIQDNLSRRGLVADYAIHCPDASDGDKNPHAHVMFTLRPVEGEGFGKKLTGYKDGGLDGKEVLEEMRFSYQEHLNRASAANEDEQQIVFDLRSYKEKGIERIPQPKIGSKVNYLEKRGYQTEWGKEVRKNLHQNHNIPYRRHVGSTQLIGTGNKYSSNFIESIRAEVAQKYYEVMYGEENAKEHWENNDGNNWYHER